MAEATGIGPKQRPLELREEKYAERSAEAIRQDIAARRDSISQTVDQLGERIQEKLDWRHQVGQHPFASIAIAAAAGLIVSSIFRRRRSPRERIMDAVAEVVEDFTDQARYRIASVVGRGSTRGRVGGYITALAAQAAASLVKTNLAGTSRSRTT